MIIYYFLLSVTVIMYIIIMDKNVIPWLILNFKLFIVNLQRVKFMMIYHPRNPITNWLAARRYRKIAKEIHEKLSKQDSSETGSLD